VVTCPATDRESGLAPNSLTSPGKIQKFKLRGMAKGA
jgi:hypothetical protein